MCLQPGGILEPGATLDLGHWDETCLLSDGGSETVSVFLTRPDEPARTFQAKRSISPSEIVSRWVPEAYVMPEACICRGSEVGPHRERVRDLLEGWLLLDLPDGGLRRVRYGSILTID